MEELERKARALRISETGTNITEVPHQQPGFRRRKIQELDESESCLDFSESGDVETEVEEVCNALNGGDPDADLNKYIAARSIENIREALARAYKALNEVLLESIDHLIDEAVGLGITVDEDKFHALRSNVFHEENENQFMSDLTELGMPEAVHLVMKGRCELAWVKDNRDRLVDYVEEAKAIREVDGTHQLHFEFYSRAMEIELLEDEQRDLVRAGRSEEGLPSNADIRDGIEIPTKRKKSTWHTDTIQSTASSIDREAVEDDEMQD
jgi:hypothetical protein